MSRFDYVVVGAGFAGSVCAERLASAGYRVIVVERRGHVGGNAYDRVNAAGVRQHEYGAHVFHTNAQPVVDYLSQFTDWRPYRHHVLAAVGERLVPFPITPETVAAFDGSLEAAKAALLTPYTRKQWGRYADDLDAAVLARVKPRDQEDRHYFADRFQAQPADGYSALFDRMLRHTHITLALNWDWCRFRACHPELVAAAQGIVVTSPLDQFFEFVYGHLPYRSARFTFQTIRNVARVLPAPVVNYPEAGVPYTRVAEFTQLTGQIAAHTTLAWEHPTDEGEPYWPVPNPASESLAERYRALAASQQPTVHLCGRLGTFRYLNMDQAVAQALKVSERILATARTKEPV